MSDILKKLEENLGYGISSFQDNFPVQEVEFPVTDEPVVNDIDQVDPTSSIVTTGETTPMGMNREDQRLEDQLNTETVSEVGNLLITIGYILQKDELIDDKFNMSEVLDFLNHNFNQPSYPTEENPPQEEIEVSPGVAYIQERKLLEESKK